MGLPPLHDAWARELLGSSPPEEAQATCHDCVMCKKPDDSAQAPAFFDPRTKCCTYFPRLSNFLVGRILDETDPGMAAGVRAVAARVEAGVASTPLGLGPSPQHALAYGAMNKDGFGRVVTLRCPYYVAETGGCGIWRHRNSVCATWFCKHDRGAVGRRFWMALNRLFTTVENELAIHCAIEVGLDEESVRRLATQLTPDQPGSAPPDGRQLDGERAADYDALWGAWRGREAELFRKCANVAAEMSWGQVLATGGARARLDAAEVANAWRALASDEVPARLRFGSFTARAASPGSVCMRGYSGTDELEAPAVVLEVLSHFDGRPLEEVLGDVEAQTGVELERAFVRKLVDFEILVP